jgi:chromatin remodeling complex protein RSC6
MASKKVKQSTQPETVLVQKEEPVKEKKTKKVAEQPPKVETPAPAPVEAAPVKEKKTKKSQAADAPGQKPESPKEKKPETPSKKKKEVSVSELDTNFEELLKGVEGEMSAHKDSGSNVKYLKTLAKSLKQLKVVALKAAAGKKKVKKEMSANSNNGFTKEVVVSKEMREFAGLKDGEMISRINVTKAVNKYIKDNNLQNPNNKREILPDSKLASLLGTKDPITYFNIQKPLQKHYVK